MAGVDDEPVGAAGRPRRSAGLPARYRRDDDEGSDERDALAAPPPDAAPTAGRKRGRGASIRARTVRRRGRGEAVRDRTRRRAGGLARRRTPRGRGSDGRNVGVATEDVAVRGTAGDAPVDAAPESAADADVTTSAAGVLGGDVAAIKARHTVVV